MFGQSQGSTGGSGFSFGNTNNANSGPTFGNTAGATGAPAFGQGGSTFGANTNPATNTGNSLFGSATNSTANTSVGAKPQAGAQAGGIFGSSSSTASSGPAFGQTNTTTNTGSGLFGNTNTNTNTGSTGMFGNNNANTSNTSTFGNPGGLFGNNSAPAPSTGGFVNNGAATTGLTGGLFGNTATANTNTTTGGLFGNNAAAPAGGTTGGLFGNNNATNTAANTAANTTGGGLFGKSTAVPSGGLFGNTGTSAGTAAPSGGLFGNKPAASFPTSNGALGATSQPLVATINRAAYELPDVTPSVKLYTSLTAKPSDKQTTHKQEKQVAPPLPLVTRKHVLEPAAPKPEARKLMNSYKRFLEERPTNLQIKRSKLVVNPVKPLALPKPPQEEKKDPNFSIFHKVDKDVNTLTINKRALEQGYFVRPSLEDLLVYTKPQLKAVKNLIIGRTGYGQIEYPDEVDLSTLGNLGDLLGNLVQFNLGTVSVYPDEEKKAKEGTELNKPAVVTIENVAPRDQDGNVIDDNSDPRVGKFSVELKKRCEAKGAEFITFTRGIWVFKVPHFSVWGITPQEMIMEDDTPEKILSDNDESMEIVEHQSETPSEPSSPDDFVSAIEPEIKDPVLSLTLVPRQDSPVQLIEPQPSSWAELMKKNVLLGASSDAVPSTTSISAVRSAVFAAPQASTPNKQEKPASKQTKPAKFTDSDLLMPLEDLKSRTAVLKRQNGLAKLSTKIGFGDLERIGSANPAWSIAAMLFEPSKEVKESLSVWIKKSASNTPSSLGGMDLVWYLVTIHSLEEAASRATALGNIRLASMIACLADRRPQNQENARHLLESLAKNGTIYEIPEVERRILEVASGNLTSSNAQSDGNRSIPQLDILQGLNWRQRIGMYLWYGTYTKSTTMGELVKKAVKDAPEDNTELAMLKLVGDSNNLSALLELVDEPTAFLLLQALESSAQMVGSRSQLADELYETFSDSLAAEGRASWAIFVCLHIQKDEQAMALTRKILTEFPNYQFDESYLAPELVNEAAAQYSYEQGDYRVAAEKWIRAGLYDRAHEVIVEHVAPLAVIQEDMQPVVALLDQCSANSIPEWSAGGKVYRDFYQYTQSPSDGLAQSLSQSVRTLATTSLETRAAATLMSNYLATRAGSSLTTSEVMKMPLGADVVSVQASLRALNDLEAL